MNTLSLLQESLSNALAAFGGVFWFFSFFWFLILPPLFYFIFKLLWYPHVWNKYASGLQFVLLELIPPREIEASPLPMESVFAGIAGAKQSATTVEHVIKGHYQATFSLEVASLEGQVHFYIRTQKSFRNLVEAQFYAQYPTMEIVEVEDYMDRIPRTAPNKDWNVWGTDFEFVKPDAYPIRTYKYFEESVTGKMVDPLSALIETMSKAGPGQYMLLQYIIAPEEESWYKTGMQAVDELLGREKPHSPGILEHLLDGFVNLLFFIINLGQSSEEAKKEEKKNEQPLEFKLTLGQREILKAIEANMSKIMFRAKMRYVYVGRNEGFAKSTGVSSIIGAIKQFNDQSLNSVKLYNPTKTEAHYVLVGPRLRYMQRRILNRFRLRSTYPAENVLHFSIEELATIFHIPDMAIVAPSLSRVAAKRGGAPSNLPIE
ncbi:MAG: hypothetical protein WDN67_05610 [Candidatus Moraniibacteriota bacterium]